jgi:transglutaminase-like putative cysteine protease
MIPPDRHGDQALASYALDVRGASSDPTIVWHTDLFDNRICRVAIDRVERALDFEVRFSVGRGAPAPPSIALNPGELQAYLGFTALTKPDANIHSAALEIGRRAFDARTCAEMANDWAACALAYRIGVTGTTTPAAMALLLGQGVCQDFAHILLSVLRCMGIPARYVSGHLLGEGAPHAWVEVLHLRSDGVAEIVAYDPTHRRRAEGGYITVATGRDFSDVTPTSGVFSGTALGTLHWSKQASQVDQAGTTARTVSDDEVALDRPRGDDRRGWWRSSNRDQFLNYQDGH